MNRSLYWAGVASGCLALAEALADTTIDATNRHAFGANLGWVDWQADTNHGAVIGQYYCTGFVYAANAGWIHLGGGPTNGYAYSNQSAGDCGVNHDGAGNLRGYAYGANIGWIAFEALGAPTLDLRSGRFNGYAYGANVGWISLSNAQAMVQTDQLEPGPDTNANGLPDPWEWKWAGNLTELDASRDTDGDGATDLDEYHADTDPISPADYLAITDHVPGAGGSTSAVQWASTPTRYYYVHQAEEPTLAQPWPDSGLGLVMADPGAFTRRVVTNAPGTQRQVYRVRAVVPLAP